ncbi:Sm-like ribonucleoprotein [Atractiella rhizophila]|nr:Sm-like ribonucleoprotein [Atractiella rhizophila]
MQSVNQDPLANAPFTTSGALVDSVDKKIIVLLRDGRKLIGVLRSYDQYANLVLQDTLERIHHGRYYGEVHRGVYLVRGENVVLLGEIDLDNEDPCLSTLTKVEEKDYKKLQSIHSTEQRALAEQRKEKEKTLYERCGFSSEGGEGDSY